MVFVEAPLFTRQVLRLLSDEEYGTLQAALIARPDAGDLIVGTGGLRKLRWRRSGTGKRGGARVIYYWLSADFEIRLLMMYPKSVKDDLAVAEKAALRRVVENWNG
ncbi:MAG TPA: hypothetical protein VFE23_16895 [Usitatibacter sp.]|jgi:hypothetical protein|nr:hypothetical protein [Usitatibacter sp.]